MFMTRDDFRLRAANFALTALAVAVTEFKRRATAASSDRPGVRFGAT